MKKLTQQDLEELIDGDSDADAANRKNVKKKKKKRNHIYNKESE
jgi:hypothetical protein